MGAGEETGASVMMGELGDAGWREARGDKRWTPFPRKMEGPDSRTQLFPAWEREAMFQEGGKASMCDGEM